VLTIFQHSRLAKMGRDKYAKQSLGALNGRVKDVRLVVADMSEDVLTMMYSRAC
jgi:hypothetical protein